MTPEAAQKIWLMYNDELTALPDALKMAQNSLKADQSLDRYESKTILAKILYVMWKELASDHEVKQGCNGINHENEFVTAMAANFLVEPALSARKVVYETLQLPPPDETGGSLTSRLGGVRG
eukprot:CAMPEP_0174721608 /NCGR_PEP_ID=MMETSP1094-20130205/36660_1 /TAXON_ID=156173 /ORGANISM="Chrysochromulina brevifilum, Strain UTEX LB 985" /LENGTH=121 /DNA_ID=CAMNT_0015922331 /DNA_START=130 /DNA_END=495 /DNA_ORIENTATION=-